MTEGSSGGHDSRSKEELPAPDDQEPGDISDNGEIIEFEASDHRDGLAAQSRTADVDTYEVYQRGLDLLGRGSAAAAAQLLERAAAAEPESRSVLEALARAQFDARRYAEAAGSFGKIVEASPSDDYAQFGLGLALARTGDPAAAAEHLALAVAMRPDLRHYSDALRSVRATLRARNQARSENPEPPQTGAAG
jgi:tetratricopeptide (TPR) repeat protein